MSHAHHCPRCRRPATPPPPPPGARLLLLLVVGSAALVLGLLPLTGIGMVFALPLVLVGGLGIGPAWRAAFPPAVCPACGCELAAAPATLPSPAVARVEMASR